jgi:hypothetical protein
VRTPPSLSSGQPAPVDGPEAAARLAAALASVGGALPYLRATVGPPAAVLAPGAIVADGDWLNCDELLADAAWLEATIRSAGRRLGAPSGAVAASLFVCCALMGGVAPGSETGAMAVSLSNGRPTAMAYRRPAALLLEDAGTGTGTSAGTRTASPARFVGSVHVTAAIGFIVERAIEGHLRALVDTVCARTRVGRRVLWGNVAAMAAVAFGTVEGLLGPEVKALGEHFFVVAPQELHGQGNFVSVEHEGRSGWFWERRNCCLNDRLPEHIRCRGCSLIPRRGRLAQYLAALDAGP